MLFADLAGYTRTSEHLDIEAVEGLLEPYHGVLRESVHNLGGSVAKVMGDGVMAVFGAVRAHEDDAERAVRCALRVAESMAELPQGTRSLAVRVGVTTGEALVTVADDGSVDAVGDVVNTAARLESAAPINGVLVDQRTYRATHRAVRYAGHAAVKARGKSRPVSVWQAVEPLSTVPTEPSDDDVPLVGRERERATLLEALDRALGERRATLVTVVGEPGIGKTRLLREFTRIVEQQPGPLVVRRGRSPSYGESIAFWALGEMIKQQAGIRDADDVQTAARKLNAAVRAALPRRDATWVARHLRPLVGLEADDAAAAGGQVEAFAAWRRFLEALSDQAPLMLVFEDVHWADDALLDFIESLVDHAARLPLLVVATTRPELFGRRGTWGREGMTIELGPMTVDETRRLVRELLSSAEVPDEVADTLASASDGNPLYAREYLRMLEEQGRLERGEGGWGLAAAPEQMPESVQAVIAARIDTLPAAERAFVHDAAVVGRTAPIRAVCALADLDASTGERMVTDIAARQLIRRVPGRTGDESQIAFTHALIQDVAYTQTRRADRADKHERTAAWLESAGSGRDDTAELIAHHFRAALNLRRALGQEVGALATRTGKALVAAGHQAEAVNNHPAAARHYTAAEALLPADGSLSWARARAACRADEPDAATLLARAYDALIQERRFSDASDAAELLGDLHRERDGDLDTAERWWAAAVQLAEQTGNVGVLVTVADGRAAVAVEQQRFDDASAIAEAGSMLAEASGDVEGTARLRVRHGYAEVCLAENQGITRIRRAASTLARIGSRYAASAYTDLSLAEMLIGDLRAAAASCERAAELAQRFGEPRVLGDIESRRAFFAYQAGDWETAREISTRHLTASNRWGAGFCIWTHGLIAIAEGDEAAAREDTAALRRIQAPSAATCAVALARSVRAVLGSRIRVPPWPSAHSYRNWDICSMAELVDIPSERQAVARYAATLPDATSWKSALAAAGRGEFGQAADRFEQIGSMPLAARAHASEAATLQARGDSAMAASHRNMARAFFEAVGATRYAERETPSGA